MMRIFVLLVLTSLLSGCGGASFVRNDAGPAVNDMKDFGVVLADYTILGPDGEPVQSERLHNVASEILTKEVAAALQEKGISPKILTEKDIQPVIDKYTVIPINWRKERKIEDVDTLGDFTPLFKSLNVDGVIILSGWARVMNPRGAVAGLLTTAGTIAASRLSGLLLTSGPVPPINIFRITLITPDGRIVYYDREQFTKRGDILNPEQRADMLKSSANRFVQTVDSLKKP